MVRRVAEILLVITSWVSSLGVVAVVVALVAFLVYRSASVLDLQLFFGDVAWPDAVFGGARVLHGIWPAIAGTLILIAASSAVAIPLGIAAGVFISEYASGRFRATITFLVDVLAGTPSIIMGLFGFSMILLLRQTIAPDAGTGLLVAAVCLALLVLPYMIRATQNALEGLPAEMRLLGASMGMSHSQSVLRILIPAASRGILSGAVLSLGRAAEDTAVIMLTGAVATAGGRGPQSLTDKFEALPFKIFVIAAEHNTAEELSVGFASALVLLVLTASLFSLTFILQRSLERLWKA
ncbi:MAG: ABC transporter permease subunit [Coriobacteriia bacterium]|nr:ABC transporter permease subunit [Coriobacteriia bacterium]